MSRLSIRIRCGEYMARGLSRARRSYDISMHKVSCGSSEILSSERLLTPRSENCLPWRARQREDRRDTIKTTADYLLRINNALAFYAGKLSDVASRARHATMHPEICMVKAARILKSRCVAPCGTDSKQSWNSQAKSINIYLRL